MPNKTLLAMPKSAAARKRTVLAMPAVAQCAHVCCRTARLPTSTREEEEQLAQAILESKAFSMQTDTYKASLATLLELSKVAAEEEAAESEAFRLAIAASLAEDKQKGLGLGLKMAASSFPAVAVAMSSNTPSNHTMVVAEPVAEAMPVAGATLMRILKVTYEQDTRRLRTQWQSDAQPLDILASIRTTVEESFGVPLGSAVPPEYSLKYSDDEGDLCTLVEETVADFLEVASQGATFKVILEKRLQSKEPEILEDFACVPSMHSNGPESLVDYACTEEGIHNTETESSQDFSISTPPVSPRCSSPVLCGGTIEDDYESMWSLVEVERHAH